MHRHRLSSDLSTGSYSASSGLPHIRQSVAQFISRRDVGVLSYAKDIFITAGSQRGLKVKYAATMTESSLFTVQTDMGHVSAYTFDTFNKFC